ncbi:DNA-binding protein [Aliarcobacter butzleri]|uniref:DNA-binding protein n=1 Tax=Aliarcobacter butzleri TaxID=28197 RepID=A0AAW6VJR6_9BACT|nr:DNA-binding protein [Aliarcobacter butzleri]MCG3684506.1 DNA-binding protein [Aliarcobacter butzleri]MCT7568908.1 DNA-binding protein [Aliarcobacter butzleri]MCT7571381.1 DNA-binding protein [Aliarcobacter butzleri]MCT7636467.1 DNA-binding protein [Aliarcobacter butzleri]MCT7650859.1 DNA-binding protein [Aliarcobacter butzleri]
MRDLTVSQVQRQNILNNNLALQEVEKNVGIQTNYYEDEMWLTKKQVQEFYEISDSTIERYIEKNSEELTKNGYKVLRGKALKDYKENDATLMSEGSKISVLGIFSFRAFLNLGMLLTESEKAKVLRSMILDIVIDVMNQKAGGHTKYINQRDEDFLIQIIKEENYRKKFTDALNKYVAMGNIKYAVYTNKVYQAIFNENANEYREILKLDSKENIRHTMYSEILAVIAGFENGIADSIEQEYKKKGRKLTSNETDLIFIDATKNPYLEPVIEKARNKMASWDLCFRDALHENLKNYISAVPKEDFHRFLGNKSKSLEERLEETKEVFLRLKDR